MATVEAGGRRSRSTGGHDALLYRSEAEYVDGIGSFLEPSLETGSPAFVAVPRPKADLLRRRLGAGPDSVMFADMMNLGQNPARIIPAIQEFVDGHPDGGVIRFVGEPIWVGRTPAEVCEATRHEALLNAVFGHLLVDILCPYDANGLAPTTIADAALTHPVVVDGGVRQASSSYRDPATMYDPADPLPIAPDDAIAMVVRPHGLGALRHAVGERAVRLGLSAERASDLVLAANEIATNTLMYTDGRGVLRIWPEDGFVVCEVRDTGRLQDPLAGRRRPSDDVARGRGLWIANALCDLVQWRSTADGTTVRLHVR